MNMQKRTKKTTLTNNIEALRLERGMSQRALGAQTNMTGPSVNRIEKSQRGLDINDLFVFARALDVHPNKIVDMSEFDGKTAELDQTVLSMVIGWILEAGEKAGMDIPAKKLGEWSSFAYKEIIEQDMPFQEMRKYTYNLVKLHAGSGSRK